MTIKEKLNKIRELSEVDIVQAEAVSLIAREIEEDLKKSPIRERIQYKSGKLILSWMEIRRKQWRFCVASTDNLDEPEEDNFFPILESPASLRMFLKEPIEKFLDHVILHLQKNQIAIKE